MLRLLQIRRLRELNPLADQPWSKTTTKRSSSCSSGSTSNSGRTSLSWKVKWTAKLLQHGAQRHRQEITDIAATMSACHCSLMSSNSRLYDGGDDELR